MLEGNGFRFIPAKDETYDQIVLIAPDQEPGHPRNFSGIIKTGDKCVHHSKLNPKQRRKIDNISKEIEVRHLLVYKLIIYQHHSVLLVKNT